MSNLTEEDKDISSEQETVKFLKKHRPPKFLTLGADYINHLRAVFDYRAWFSWESKPTKIDLPNIGDNTSGSLELEDTYSIEVQYENSTEIVIKKLNELSQGISVKGISIIHNPTENNFNVDFTQYNKPNTTVLVTIKKLIDTPVLEHTLANSIQYETVAPVKIKFTTNVNTSNNGGDGNDTSDGGTSDDNLPTDNPVNEQPSTVRDPSLTYPLLAILGVASEQDLNDTTKYAYKLGRDYYRQSNLDKSIYQYTSFADYVAKGNREIDLILPEKENQLYYVVEEMTMSFNVDNLIEDLKGFTFNIMQNQTRPASSYRDYRRITFYGNSKTLDMVSARDAINNVPNDPIGNSKYFINQFAGLPSPAESALTISSRQENIFNIHQLLSNDNLSPGMPAYKLYSAQYLYNGTETKTRYWLIYKKLYASFNSIMTFDELGRKLSDNTATPNLEIPEHYLNNHFNLTLVYDYTQHDLDLPMVRSIHKIGKPVVYIPSNDGGFKLYE